MSDLTKSEKFIPPNPAMGWAIMRNAHESIRAAITESSVLLENNKNEDFASLWTDLTRAISIHMTIEDIDAFPLLQKQSNTWVDENLEIEHINDHTLMESITKLVENGELVSIELFNQWKESHLTHLQHEEKVMTPLTMKTGGSHEERASVVNKLLVTPAFQRNSDEFLWYVGWCIKMLSKSGSVNNPAGVAVRVFSHGLQASTTILQWGLLKEVIQKNTTSEIWEDMVTNYKIDQDGLQSD